MNWTNTDEATARAEGWTVSASSEAMYPNESREIMRFDGSTKFNNDGEAVAHVYWKALEGSELHRRALILTLDLTP